MIFWDSSAVTPLCVQEVGTPTLSSLYSTDPRMYDWWGTPLECTSAFQRLVREGNLSTDDFVRVRDRLAAIMETWSEIQPSMEIRNLAERLLAVHPLRAADSLQLASAVVWTDHQPRGMGFACLDHRLRQAAQAEGFRVLPKELPEKP